MMNGQTITAIMLVIPLAVMVVPTIRYWRDYRKDSQAEKAVQKLNYNKPFYYLLAGGFFCMWLAWVGGIILLFSNLYDRVLGALTYTTSSDTVIRAIGFLIFYLGAATCNLAIIFAGKYLRPSHSGVLRNHQLVQNGPFAVLRHPLYVSYILILVGLSFILLTYWLLLPSLAVAVGIYPTAKTEEEMLIRQVGDEYRQYQQRVGMLFPRLF
jgi:protein-S-isoprenylcysteine O-methyltransferase Ste14